MKFFWTLVLTAMLPALAGAQVQNPRVVTDMDLTFRSTMTCSGVSISSAGNVGLGATQVIKSTQTLWASISVQNLDPTCNVYCGDSVFVTSSTNSGAVPNVGWELAPGYPGGSQSFFIGPGELFYCVNDTITRASTIAVCRGR